MFGPKFPRRCCTEAASLIDRNQPAVLPGTQACQPKTLLVRGGCFSTGWKLLPGECEGSLEAVTSSMESPFCAVEAWHPHTACHSLGACQEG